MVDGNASSSPILYCSAIIEHTNRVLYMEDNDVVAITSNGGMLVNYNNIHLKMTSKTLTNVAILWPSSFYNKCVQLNWVIT